MLMRKGGLGVCCGPGRKLSTGYAQPLYVVGAWEVGIVGWPITVVTKPLSLEIAMTKSLILISLRDNLHQFVSV